MSLSKYNQYDILFLLVIIGFVIFKWPHLSLPYIFDEAHFYGPAVAKMHEAGPSLSPTSIPVFYSRGHPLFFHFLGASWMTLAGNSLLSSHLFALSLSILLLFSIYYFCSESFSKKIGLTAVAFLVVQPIFLAQSNLVLPEILLALLMVTALLAYLSNHKLIYWIAAALAMLTKESALILFCTIPLYQLLDYYFNPQQSFATLIKSIFFTLSPISIWLLFLIWQKITLGWFFFPEHQGLIDLTPSVVWEKFTRILLIVFIWSGRNTITFTAAGLVAFFFFKNKKTILPKTIPYLTLLLLFCLLFALFSSLNFFTNRYIISLVVLTTVMGSSCIHLYSPKKYITWIAIITILCVGIYNTLYLRYDCDHNLGYVDAALSKRLESIYK